MKKLLIALSLLTLSSNTFAGFIHPMDFDGSDDQKNEVIKYIKAQVREEYRGSSESLLRDWEKYELEVFKKLSEGTNRELMDNAIVYWCSYEGEYCSYDKVHGNYIIQLTVLRREQAEKKAALEELTW